MPSCVDTSRISFGSLPYMLIEGLPRHDTQRCESNPRTLCTRQHAPHATRKHQGKSAFCANLHLVGYEHLMLGWSPMTLNSVLAAPTSPPKSSPHV